MPDTINNNIRIDLIIYGVLKNSSFLSEILNITAQQIKRVYFRISILLQSIYLNLIHKVKQ